MTYITKRCGKCGFTHRASIYGYVHNPIGVPVSRCPQCGELYRERQNREWVQMSPFKKYRSIHPRGWAMAFFLGILLAILMGLGMMTLLQAISSASLLLPAFIQKILSVLYVVLCFVSPVLCFVFPFFLAHYMLTCLHVGSESFRVAYCDSILRTRNPEYREYLSKQGPLYDEGIPNWVLCTKGAKEMILAYLDEHTDNVDVKIPTFVETINNA